MAGPQLTRHIVRTLDLAIPIIPLDEIGAFLRSHRILGADELNKSAYVIAGGQEHLITANGATTTRRLQLGQ